MSGARTLVAPRAAVRSLLYGGQTAFAAAGRGGCLVQWWHCSKPRAVVAWRVLCAEGTWGSHTALAAVQACACTAKFGRGRLAATSSSSVSSFPRHKGDEHSLEAVWLWLLVVGRRSASVRRCARGGVRGDLGRWCEKRGERGVSLISSVGPCLSVALCALCPLAFCALSGTLAFL